MAYPTTLSFRPIALYAVGQAVADTSTTKNFALGARIRAVDDALGEVEFIYLAGVASTAAGDLVTYDAKAGTTTRSGAGARGPMAVAMSANVASQYGWYAVYGVVPVKSGTTLASKPAYLTSTAGQIDDAVVSGDKVDGLTTQAADSGGFAYCFLANPFANGNG